jgi:hypothetical protein
MPVLMYNNSPTRQHNIHKTKSIKKGNKNQNNKRNYLGTRDMGSNLKEESYTNLN